MLSEFKAFLLNTNALLKTNALAVGVIIGAASGMVVSALVADILSD
jgi:large-conductance mechanosensitive channel